MDKITEQIRLEKLQQHMEWIGYSQLDLFYLHDLQKEISLRLQTLKQPPKTKPGGETPG